MVEGGRLESVCTARYRGFKSLLLRQMSFARPVFARVSAIEKIEEEAFLAQKVVHKEDHKCTETPFSYADVRPVCTFDIVFRHTCKKD